VKPVPANGSNRDGEVITGIRIAGPVFRVTEANVLALAGLVVEATRWISMALGLRSTPAQR
jgi:DNA-binding IclR family transcriptional regulator